MSRMTVVVTARMYDSEDYPLRETKAAYAVEHGYELWQLEVEWVGGELGPRKEVRIYLPEGVL